MFFMACDVCCYVSKPVIISLLPTYRLMIKIYPFVAPRNPYANLLTVLVAYAFIVPLVIILSRLLFLCSRHEILNDECSHDHSNCNSLPFVYKWSLHLPFGSICSFDHVHTEYKEHIHIIWHLHMILINRYLKLNVRLDHGYKSLWVNAKQVEIHSDYRYITITKKHKKLYAYSYR